MKRAALLLLGACDVVYGLGDRPDGSGPIRVEGTLARYTVDNALDHTPRSTPLALTAEDAPLATSDGDALEVTFDPVAGAFTFDAPGPYEVRIGNVEWQASTPRLVLDDVRYGREDAEPATAVTLNVSFTPPTEIDTSYELVSTGVWNRQAIAPAPAGTTTVDWSAGSFFGAAPRKLDTARGDTLHLLTRTGAGAQSPVLLTRSAPVDIRMIEGAQPVTFALQVAPPAGCARVIPSAGTELARLQQRYPTYTASSVAGWEIDAAPLVAAHGLRLSLALATRYQVAADDEAIVTTFANPYAGTDVVLIQASNVVRTVDGASLTASVTYRRALAVVAGGPCDDATASQAPLGLPHGFELAGVPLVDDRLVLGLADRAYVDFQWEIDGALPDGYVVDLFEIVAPSTLVVRRSITTVERRVRLATSTFVPGARYALRVGTRSNRPGFATGDFAQRPLPDGFVVAFTSTFTVVQ